MMAQNGQDDVGLSGWIDPSGAWHDLTIRSNGGAGLHEGFAKSLGKTVPQMMLDGWVRVDVADRSVMYAFQCLNGSTGKRVAADAQRRDPRAIFWIDVLAPRRHTRFDGLLGLIAGVA